MAEPRSLLCPVCTVDATHPGGFCALPPLRKAGRGAQPVSLDESLVVSPTHSTDLVAVDDALKALAKVDGRKAQVVELRFFGGLTVEESAEVLKVSPETVRRDWKLAKVWLLRELSQAG